MSNMTGYDAYCLSKYRTYHNYNRDNDVLGKPMHQIYFERIQGNMDISASAALGNSIEGIVVLREKNTALHDRAVHEAKTAIEKITEALEYFDDEVAVQESNEIPDPELEKTWADFPVEDYEELSKSDRTYHILKAIKFSLENGYDGMVDMEVIFNGFPKNPRVGKQSEGYYGETTINFTDDIQVKVRLSFNVMGHLDGSWDSIIDFGGGSSQNAYIDKFGYWWWPYKNSEFRVTVRGTKEREPSYFDRTMDWMGW